MLKATEDQDRGRSMLLQPTRTVEHWMKNNNPSDIGFMTLLREDLRTHDNQILEPGFWAIALHRFGNWRMSIRLRILRLPFSIFYRIGFRWLEWTCGISITYTTRLGRRVRIWHQNGIVINARAIGDDVHLRHNTTMGVVSRSKVDQLPSVGNRVDIGCQVCVLGPITVGDDTVIGAGSVVIRDIPPRMTAVGVPARIVQCEAGDSTNGRA